jgi:hypothetical protein
MEIDEKVIEMKKQLDIHRQRLGQAQQVAEIETKEIIALQGAIREFNNFLADTNKNNSETNIIKESKHGNDSRKK